MYQRFLNKTNHSHLLYFILVLIVALASAHIISYLLRRNLISEVEAVSTGQTNYMLDQLKSIHDTTFVITLLIILILGVFIDILVHIAKRDGFNEGFRKGLQESSPKPR